MFQEKWNYLLEQNGCSFSLCQGNKWNIITMWFHLYIEYEESKLTDKNALYL